MINIYFLTFNYGIYPLTINFPKIVRTFSIRITCVIMHDIHRIPNYECFELNMTLIRNIYTYSLILYDFGNGNFKSKPNRIFFFSVDTD